MWGRNLKDYVVQGQKNIYVSLLNSQADKNLYLEKIKKIVLKKSWNIILVCFFKKITYFGYAAKKT